MSKEAFNEAMAYVRALDEQDQSALTAADALAAAVEGILSDHTCEYDGCDIDERQFEWLTEKVAEYRRIRAQSAPEPILSEKGD